MIRFDWSCQAVALSITLLLLPFAHTPRLQAGSHVSSPSQIFCAGIPCLRGLMTVPLRRIYRTQSIIPASVNAIAEPLAGITRFWRTHRVNIVDFCGVISPIDEQAGYARKMISDVCQIDDEKYSAAGNPADPRAGWLREKHVAWSWLFGLLSEATPSIWWPIIGSHAKHLGSANTLFVAAVLQRHGSQPPCAAVVVVSRVSYRGRSGTGSSASHGLPSQGPQPKRATYVARAGTSTLVALPLRDATRVSSRQLSLCESSW
ncbi:hypothetical protein DOTSEDRAFT_35455 [Dothistroma septosporum NZE10]|uniref:Uncharacterized protein n=1 Tax=Dothistroma septosporum (strain NZE10 / CBS 128990) TaxID=675120 RepID=M2WM64_DOTSN|nr:hypothetical protein DOTSEDRAFT_35455 [Dothistroma septosporum NZE10]